MIDAAKPKHNVKLPVITLLRGPGTTGLARVTVTSASNTREFITGRIVLDDGKGKKYAKAKLADLELLPKARVQMRPADDKPLALPVGPKSLRMVALIKRSGGKTLRRVAIIRLDGRGHVIIRDGQLKKLKVTESTDDKPVKIKGCWMSTGGDESLAPRLDVVVVGRSGFKPVSKTLKAGAGACFDQSVEVNAKSGQSLTLTASLLDPKSGETLDQVQVPVSVTEPSSLFNKFTDWLRQHIILVVILGVVLALLLMTLDIWMGSRFSRRKDESE